MFRRNMPLPYSGLKRKLVRVHLSKRFLTYTTLHDVTSQRAVVFIFNAVRISVLT
jgi:hypothetical protein